jgi:hypothetical protein
MGRYCGEILLVAVECEIPNLEHAALLHLAYNLTTLGNNVVPDLPLSLVSRLFELPVIRAYPPFYTYQLLRRALAKTRRSLDEMTEGKREEAVALMKRTIQGAIRKIRFSCMSCSELRDVRNDELFASSSAVKTRVVDALLLPAGEHEVSCPVIPIIRNGNDKIGFLQRSISALPAAAEPRHQECQYTADTNGLKYRLHSMMLTITGANKVLIRFRAGAGTWNQVEWIIIGAGTNRSEVVSDDKLFAFTMTDAHTVSCRPNADYERRLCGPSPAPAVAEVPLLLDVITIWLSGPNPSLDSIEVMGRLPHSWMPAMPPI